MQYVRTSEGVFLSTRLIDWFYVDDPAPFQPGYSVVAEVNDLISKHELKRQVIREGFESREEAQAFLDALMGHKE